MKKAIVILALLMQSSLSYSCDCDKTIGLKEAVNVFEGRVMGIRRIEAPYIRYEITFKISKAIKGALKSKTITVNVPCLNVGCCGIPFEMDSNYVVYTFMKNKKMYSFC